MNFYSLKKATKITFLYLFILCSSSFSTPVLQFPKTLTFQTIHGTLVVDDPLAIELIQSPAMQRLKGILQYGVNEFIQPSRYPYTRFDHSLGVYQLLKMHNASRKEQIAGLLHDISHTVFSHLADMLFLKGFDKGNYQDKIHERFLEEHGIKNILQKYGFTVTDILPDTGDFQALEQELPNLCADRIEYNIHAGDLEQFLSPGEIQEIHQALHFDGKNWFFDNILAAEKLAEISIHQTIHNWSSSDNVLISKWIAEAMAILATAGEISFEDIHFTFNDEKMWKTLCNTKIPTAQKLLATAKSVKKCYSIQQEGKGQAVFKFKSRAIDPFVQIDNELYRLTELCPTYKRKFENLKKMATVGWHLTINPECQ